MDMCKQRNFITCFEHSLKLQFSTNVDVKHDFPNNIADACYSVSNQPELKLGESN